MLIMGFVPNARALASPQAFVERKCSRSGAQGLVAVESLVGIYFLSIIVAGYAS